MKREIKITGDVFIRTFQIDFTAQEVAEGLTLGRIGEHNASQLVITPPAELSEDERTNHYRAAFFCGGETYLSERYNEIPFTVPLWKELTAFPSLSFQIIAYDEDGEFIGKSRKLCGFEFEASVSGAAVEIKGENADIAHEIEKLSERASEIAEYITSESVRAQEAEDGKVSKEQGKGLSSNDYTDEEKQKLASLENYDDEDVYSEIAGLKDDLDALDNAKVDAVSGKVLSSNDYTDAEKQKLGKIKKNVFYGTAQRSGGVQYVITDEDFELENGVIIFVTFTDGLSNGNRLNVNSTGEVSVGYIYNKGAFGIPANGVGVFTLLYEKNPGYPDAIQWMQTDIHFADTSYYGMVKLSDSINGDVDYQHGALAATPAAVKALNDLKQDNLTAGTNITIENNVISASGGGSLPSGTTVGDLLVWNGSEWIAQTPSRLPAEYQEVEYIESTGTQYLMLDIQVGNFTGMVADIQYTDAQNDGRNGVFYTNGTSIWKALSFGLISSTSTFRVQYTGSAGHDVNKDFNLSDDNRYCLKIDISRQKVYLNNTSYSVPIYDASIPLDFALFARNHSTDGIQFYCKMKAYEFIFYDTFHSEILHFIPCYRKSDDEIGMYDLVTNTFYTNQGTGVFLKGNDI